MAAASQPNYTGIPRNTKDHTEGDCGGGSWNAIDVTRSAANKYFVGGEEEAGGDFIGWDGAWPF